jgi:Lrp/AsnC family transcriptional regulator for asnA, asnC and gidA
MASKINLDHLDLQIISAMMEDAGISYADLGKTLSVSGGTIHVRIKKLQESGIVKGTRLNVNLKELGYDITAFVGIYLEKSSLYDAVAKDLKKIPEIVRLNYTTGNYSMFIEIVCRDITQLRHVLHDELQKIKGIERTETLISLEESFNRNVQVRLP